MSADQTQVRNSGWMHSFANWRYWLVFALAAQYLVTFLVTGVTDYDVTRNLHWGIYITENPRFLFDANNTYDRINGFVPDPPTLAPADLDDNASRRLSPWWGPLYLLAYAGIWQLTGSHTLLLLTGPIAGGALVIVTYLFGRRFLSERAGLIAAALLAFFPIYREHATLALVEQFSALLQIGAVWCLLARRPWWAALLGGAAAFGKPDMIALYFGTVGVTWLLCGRNKDYPVPFRDVLIAAGVPLIPVMLWLWAFYVVVARPPTITGTPGLSTLQVIWPMALDQLFLMPFYLSLPVVVGLGAAAFSGVVDQQIPSTIRVALLVWSGLGLIVLLGYCSAPGASNNPRVMIPALPAMMLLVGHGLTRWRPRWRTYTITTLLLFFLLVNVVGITYQALQGRMVRAAMPAWSVLRAMPPGMVLTDRYWDAAFFANKPVTWFDYTSPFRTNIMDHEDRLQRYLEITPIRYIVLATSPTHYADLNADWLGRWYTALPIGRSGQRNEQLTNPAVRAYLDRTFPSQRVGQYTIYSVR